MWQALGGIMAGGQASSQMLGQIAQGVGANLAWDRQKQMLRNQQLWSQYMRSTAYQTAVEDLRKAGLNPLLAVTGPGPAQTPGGMSVPGVENPMAGAAGTGRATARMMSELKLLREQGNKTEAEKEVAEVEALFRPQIRELEKRVLTQEEQLKGYQARTQQYMMEQEKHRVTSAEAAARIDTLAIQRAVEDALRAEIGQEYLRSGTGKAAEKAGRYFRNVPLLEAAIGAFGGYIAGGRRSKTPEVKRRRR